MKLFRSFSWISYLKTEDGLILSLAFVVFFISAFFNTGYYHYDEHYQIIEFAQLKLGRTDPNHLAWEFSARIRPAFQPSIAYIIFMSLEFLNFYDPFLKMMVIRCITAVIALAVINYFVKNTLTTVEERFKLCYKLMSYFIWFIPFLNVRFSSETYSGLSFLFAIGVFYSNHKQKYLNIGLLMGLSFIFRFQTGIMSSCFIFWLILIHKIKRNTFLEIFSGLVLMVALGIVVDFWYYSRFTITFYNYFFSTILDNRAPTFGSSPWDFYFTELIRLMTIPIATLLILSVITQSFTNRTNPLLWITLPFFVIHSMIPHKELRFLFPIVNFLPLIIIQGIQILNKKGIFKKPTHLWLAQLLAACTVFVNAIALLITMLSPADQDGLMNVRRIVNRISKENSSVLFVTEDFDLFQPIVVRQTFYENNELKIANFSDKVSHRKTNAVIDLFVCHSEELQHYKRRYHCKLILLASGVFPLLVRFKKATGFETKPLNIYLIQWDQ